MRKLVKGLKSSLAILLAVTTIATTFPEAALTARAAGLDDESQIGIEQVDATGIAEELQETPAADPGGGELEGTPVDKPADAGTHTHNFVDGTCECGATEEVGVSESIPEGVEVEITDDEIPAIEKDLDETESDSLEQNPDDTPLSQEEKDAISNGDIDVIEMITEGLTNPEVDELVALGAPLGTVQDPVTDLKIDYDGKISWKAPVNGKPGYDEEDCVLRYTVTITPLNAEGGEVEVPGWGPLYLLATNASKLQETDTDSGEYKYAISSEIYFSVSELLRWNSEYGVTGFKASVVAESTKGTSVVTEESTAVTGENSIGGKGQAKWPNEDEKKPQWQLGTMARIIYQYTDVMVAAKAKTTLELYKNGTDEALTIDTYNWDYMTTAGIWYTENHFSNYIKDAGATYHVVAKTTPGDFRYTPDTCNVEDYAFGNTGVKLENVGYDSATDKISFRVVNYSYSNAYVYPSINIQSDDISMNYTLAYKSSAGYSYEGIRGRTIYSIYYVPINWEINLYDLWNAFCRENSGNAANFRVTVTIADGDGHQTKQTATKNIKLKMPKRLEVKDIHDSTVNGAGGKYNTTLSWTNPQPTYINTTVAELRNATTVKLFTGDKVEEDEANRYYDEGVSITTYGDYCEITGLPAGIYTAKIKTASNSPRQFFDSEYTIYKFAVNYDYVKGFKTQVTLPESEKTDLDEDAKSITVTPFDASAIDLNANKVKFEVYPQWSDEHPEWGDKDDVEFVNDNEAAFTLADTTWVAATSTIPGHFIVTLNKNAISSDAISGKSVITISDKKKNAPSTTVTVMTQGNKMGGMTVSYDKEQYYTGGTRNPEVVVKDGNEILKAGVDYTISYKNNKNVYDIEPGETGYSASKAPQMIITGKGQYSKNKLTLYYTIHSLELNVEGTHGVSSSTAPVYADLNMELHQDAEAGYSYINISQSAKAQTVNVPVKITDGTKTLGALKQNADYAVQYCSAADWSSSSNDKWKASIPAGATGEYYFRVVGIEKSGKLSTTGKEAGPYITASDNVNAYRIRIIALENNIESAKVTAIVKSIPYETVMENTFDIIDGYKCYPLATNYVKVTCGKRVLDTPDFNAYLVVADGDDATGKANAGKASVIVKGLGSNVGTVVAKNLITITTQYKLNAKTINAAIPDQLWKGSTITIDDIKDQLVVKDFITDKTTGTTLVRDVDYQIESIKNNAKAGNASVNLIGLHAYAGSKLTVKFKINKNAISDVETSVDSKITLFDTNGTTQLVKGSEANTYTAASQSYSKVAPKPVYIVSVNGTRLVNGKDYSISYKNNGKVGEATATIAFKGNYSGPNYTVKFNVVAADISKLNATAVDPVYKGKKGNFKAAVSVFDNGKKLSAGKDYTVEYYMLNLDEKNEDGTFKHYDLTDEIITPGARIYVKVIGKGTYDNAKSITKYVYMKPASIASAKLKTSGVALQQKGVAVDYEASVPEKITLGKLTLVKGVDFTVESLYDPITQEEQFNAYYGSVGKKTVIIKAINSSPNCGGTKNVTFTVLPKAFGSFYIKNLLGGVFTKQK